MATAARPRTAPAKAQPVSITSVKNVERAAKAPESASGRKLIPGLTPKMRGPLIQKRIFIFLSFLPSGAARRDCAQKRLMGSGVIWYVDRQSFPPPAEPFFAINRDGVKLHQASAL